MNTYTNRSRVNESPQTTLTPQLYYQHPGYTGILTVAPRRSPYYYNSIDDFTGKRKNSKGIWPPSDTVQRSFDAMALNPIATWVQDEGNGPATVTPLNGMRVPVYDSVVFNFPLASDDVWCEFAEDAFTAFSTQIPTEVGIANFTWELRELGSLIPRLEESLARQSSDGFLNFSFGWKPFVGDLQKLSSVLSTVSAKIQHLRDTWGKKTRLGLYRGNVVETDLSFWTQEFQDITTGGMLFWRWTLASYRCDLRAGGYLFHQLKDLQSVYGYIRALSVSLGLDNPLKAVWNAIPYSFVADWFTGLGRQLNKLSINPFKGKWEVSDFTSSCSTVAKWKVVQRVTTPHADHQLGYVTAKSYVRISRLPVRSAFYLTGLSPQQLLLTAAMLA